MANDHTEWDGYKEIRLPEPVMTVEDRLLKVEGEVKKFNALTEAIIALFQSEDHKKRG